MVMYTTEETNRMRALAMERFDVFATQYIKDKNEGFIKFGIVVDEEYQDKEQGEPQML